MVRPPHGATPGYLIVFLDLLPVETHKKTELDMNGKFRVNRFMTLQPMLAELRPLMMQVCEEKVATGISQRVPNYQRRLHQKESVS